MDELTAGLDALAAEDLRGRGAALLERTRELVAGMNRMAAELARTVRQAELEQAPQTDGQRTMQSWLRGHCRLSPAAASQAVRIGRALEQLPAVATAAAAGQVTAAGGGDRATGQPGHLGPARRAGRRPGRHRRNPGRLRRHPRAHRAGQAGARAARAAGSRRPRARPDQHPVTVDRQACRRPDQLPRRLDAVGGEKFQAALEAHTQADRPAGDDRSLVQRQGDALVQWADVTLGCGQAPRLRTVKPHVMVQIPLEDLRDPSKGPGAARLGFGAIISAAAARWAACDADLTRIVLSPDGLPLDLGRTVRLVPPHLRRAVVHRDRHCVFAGCDAPHHWCEVHHVVEWALGGGETSLENSGLLCERHHTQVHHGFTVDRDETGRWHTYRPDGTEILVLRPPPADDPDIARAG